VQALVESLSTAIAVQGEDSQARRHYLFILARVGAEHALLKTSAPHIMRDAAVQQIRAAEDQLRRSAAPSWPPRS